MDGSAATNSAPDRAGGRGRHGDAGHGPGGGVRGDDRWVGYVRSEAGVRSGWHHHGETDTYFYVLRGAIELEFGPGGRERLRVEAGDFAHVPRGVIHRRGRRRSAGRAALVRLGSGPPSSTSRPGASGWLRRGCCARLRSRSPNRRPSPPRPGPTRPSCAGFKSRRSERPGGHEERLALRARPADESLAASNLTDPTSTFFSCRLSAAGTTPCEWTVARILNETVVAYRFPTRRA